MPIFTLPKQVELFLWAVTPTLITFFLFLFCTINKHIWGINSAMPLLPLIPIFYWGRAQSSEMQLWFAFAIGLLTDAVSGLPLFGLSALLYMVFLMVLNSRAQQLQKQGFMFVWWYFTMLLTALFFLQFITMSIFEKHLYEIARVFLQWFLTAGLYPLFHKLFDKLSEKCQQRRWILAHS
jgi:rod shape-determining protein MreD